MCEVGGRIGMILVVIVGPMVSEMEADSVIMVKKGRWSLKALIP
jgi:hypothetical protein